MKRHKKRIRQTKPLSVSQRLLLANTNFKSRLGMSTLKLLLQQMWQLSPIVLIYGKIIFSFELCGR